MLKSELLAQFQLSAALGENDQDVYARLSGATFPFSDTLTACGAVWDRQKQSWKFDDESSFLLFADSLGATESYHTTGLEEEVLNFDSDTAARTPLGRFLKCGANALDNQDLLELLLSFDQYLVDPQTTSKRLFDEFGSLGAILGCEPERLAHMEEMTPRLRGLLKAVQLTIERVLHERVQENPVIGSSQALLDFLRARLRHRQREELVIIYVDRRNRLIKADCTEGTVNHVSLHARDIVTRALELFATAVILAHNHPGGNMKASREDITITQQVRIALETLNIELYDHVIVCDASYLSFKTEGLI